MTAEESDLAGNAESVDVSVEEGLGTIIVNRPEKLNALDNTVIAELASAFERCFDDDSISVILLTGHGEKSFVAGADIAMLAEQGVLDGKDNSRLGQDLMDLIEEGPKPAIAVVNGYALGGGLELALACDFRYAATNAVFGLPEVGLGIIPGYGGTQRLPRLVGYGHALELILSGDKIGAEEALRIGLVNRVLPPEELMEAARGKAKLIASRGPLAVMTAKEAVWRGARLPRGDALALEADLFAIVSSTEDMKEGMRAFLEKRKPEFRAE